MKKYVDGQLWTDKPRNFFAWSLSFTRYILTEEKLITRSGFLNIKEDEIMLYKIVDKSLDLPLSQRIFGCGTINITTRDHDTPDKVLRDIKKPREIMDLLDMVILNAREKYRIYGQDVMLGHGSGVGSLSGTFDLDGDGVADILQDAELK